ncbi:hypothetical protein Patl1_37478 [Pistacia atlantica]|nr:hypothetical protein Patl1_37478 [Pistacia atlantica]
MKFPKRRDSSVILAHSQKLFSGGGKQFLFKIGSSWFIDPPGDKKHPLIQETEVGYKPTKKDREKAIEERRQRRIARLRGEQPDDSQNLCIPHLRATFPKPAHVLQPARSLDSMEEQLQFSLSGLSVNTVEATAVTSFVTKSCDDDAPKNWQMKLLPVSQSLFFWGGAELSKNEAKEMIVLEWLFLTIAPCDAAEPWQLGSQDAATPMMQGIIDLHHDIFFFLILILVFVLRILVRALWHFHYKKNPIPQRIVHGTTIEILRTIFPSIIPMFIAIPSFALLYSMDEVVVDPAITIKAIGHQWYRTYEYSDYNSSDEQSLTFDSYTIPEDDLELGQSRLLEVDNRVVVPAKSHLRIIVTSADVPHSWAVPSSGVKCDAVPGRLNQISISVQREGVYYGQCSEICGTNHAFTRAPGNIGRLLSPLWLSRTTRGAIHPRSKLLQRAAGAVGSRGARQ